MKIHNQGGCMKKLEIYKCGVCGLTVEVLSGCQCAEPAVCCGRPMQVMSEQTADFKTEKHVPFPESTAAGMRVTVGKEMLHPMTEEHHIEWIEVDSGSFTYRKYLKPGDSPAADFPIPLNRGMIVREFCSIHGLWKFEVK